MEKVGVEYDQLSDFEREVIDWLTGNALKVPGSTPLYGIRPKKDERISASDFETMRAKICSRLSDEKLEDAKISYTKSSVKAGKSASRQYEHLTDFEKHAIDWLAEQEKSEPSPGGPFFRRVVLETSTPEMALEIIRRELCAHLSEDSFEKLKQDFKEHLEQNVGVSGREGRELT